MIQTCSLKLVFHIIQDAINVSGHFLSVPLTYKTVTCIKRICQMIRVSSRRMETLPAPSSSTASKNLTLTAKHGTEMRGPRLTANCRHAKRSE